MLELWFKFTQLVKKYCTHTQADPALVGRRKYRKRPDGQYKGQGVFIHQS